MLLVVGRLLKQKRGHGQFMAFARRLEARSPPNSFALQQTKLIHISRTNLKNEARKGKHLETLNELANEASRKAAQPSRKKKKDKKQPKERAGKQEQSSQTVSNTLPEQDDFDFSEVEAEIANENVLPDPSEVQQQMMKVVNAFKDSLKSIRGSEPTAGKL